MSNPTLLIVLFKNLERRIQVSKCLIALPNAVSKGAEKSMRTPKLNRVAGERPLYPRPRGYLYHCRFLLLEEREGLLRGSMRIFISSLLPVEAALLIAQLRPRWTALDACLA